MNAPEKIYLEKVYPDNGVLPNGLNYSPSPTDIEYIRTDAFIEKAVEWIKEQWDDNYTMQIIIDSVIEDFKNHMKGE